MKQPKFELPEDKKGGRTGRIILFLGSVVAVCYLLTLFSKDYVSIYIRSAVMLPVPTQIVITASQYMWAIALGAAVLTILLIVITKSGRVFTVLTILVWLTGAAAYTALWLPSRLLTAAAGG